ncbi:MAG: cytochrome c maturation protein CcmE [Bacteroidales bacterium]|nr:cytochrome c maturation protein CcmE [Bacteroidales bacterium]
MKKTHILAIIVAVVALGAILSTVADSSTYVTFSEAAQRPGKEYHVIGQLNTNKKVVYDEHNNPDEFSFYMIDNNGDEMKVIYDDSKPQDFEKSEQIVLVGQVDEDDSVFRASSLLLKCPSKYKEDDTPESFGEQKYSAE